MQRKIKMSLNLYRISLECLPCAVRVFKNLIQHSPVCCLWVVHGFMETTFCFCFSVLKVLSLSQDILAASPGQSCSLLPLPIHQWQAGCPAFCPLTPGWELTKQLPSWPCQSFSQGIESSRGSWWAIKWPDPKWCMSLVITIWPKFVTCPHPATRNQEEQSHHIPRRQRTGAICLIAPFQEWE